jgi:hypothetical protein
MIGRLVAVAAAAALVALPAGCGDRVAGGDQAARGEVQLAVTAPADVRLLRVEVQPGGQVVEIPLSAGASAANAHFSLAAGTYTFTATALAGPDPLSLVAVGSATAQATVAAGGSTQLSLTIPDTRDPPPGRGDRAPIITAFSVFAEVATGRSAPVSATATDLDGDPIAYAWTAEPVACGVFVDPAAAATSFVAGVTGPCTISVRATANGKSDVASRAVVVTPPPGTVVVTGTVVPRPSITALAVAGGGLPATSRVVDPNDATLTAPVTGGWWVGVRVEWLPQPTPVTVEVTDTCTARTYLPTWTAPGFATHSATFTWPLPAPPPGQSAACGLTAVVTVTDHPELRGEFAAGLEVVAPPPVIDCGLPAPVLGGIGFSQSTSPPGSLGPPELCWSDASGETSFEIGRSFAPGGTPEPLATVGMDTTTFADEQIVQPHDPGYCFGCAYAVRAVSPPCTSAWSNQAVAPPAPPPPVPGGPLGPLGPGATCP